MTARVIGITGGMASGKTTLARKMQAETGGIFIAVDDVRRAIGGSDADGFEALWQRIRDQVRQEVESRVRSAQGTVILEWARLIEDGFLDLADEIVVVHCDDGIRRERLKNGDLSPAQIQKRFDSQMTTEQMKQALDKAGKPYRVVNTGGEYDPDTAFCLFRIPNKGGRAIWEVTNTCNYGCRYCIFSSTSRKHADELDTAKIHETIDGLKECGFTHIKITGGEPFTRPDLIDILRYARRSGFKTDISTNAAFITEDIASELVNLGLEMIHVSLDGHTQELQEAVRGKRTYAPTMEGLKHLTGKGLYIRIGCVIYRNNQHELREMAAFCHSLGCDEVIFSLMEPVGRMRGRPALLYDRPVADMQAEIHRIRKEFSGKIKISGNFAETVKEGCGTCPGGGRFLFIDHKGRVSPCTWVAERRPAYVAEKTLHDYSLKDILHDRENKAFRHIVSGLSQSGLDRCPMQIVPDFMEAERIAALFDGDLEENLKRGGRYSETSPVYAFATENIGGYLDLFDFKDKDILTVGASGDQMVNAYAAGARTVVNFDINRLARHMAELKTALLKHLPRDRFRQFFIDFDYDVYRRNRNALSLSARYFFDQAYKNFGNDGQALRSSVLFRKQQRTEQIVENNPYLTDDRGYSIAQTACKIRPLEWNVHTAEEAAKPNGHRYDVILLSNISDYAHHMYEGDYLLSFRERVAEPMAARLRPGGRMMIGYVYDALDANKSSARSRINDPQARQAAFGNYPEATYREVEIPGAWEGNNKDVVLIWEKTA